MPVPVPPGVVTTISDDAGSMRGCDSGMVVGLTITRPVAATPPMVTAVAPVNAVPVIVTAVPPPIGPLVGLIAVTVGAATYVKSPEPVPVPAGVVTTTSTAPAACAGVVAVMEVALPTVMPVAATPPIVTAVAPVNAVPPMVTAVPPAATPLDGTIEVTVGAAAGVQVVTDESVEAVSVRSLSVSCNWADVSVKLLVSVVAAK